LPVLQEATSKRKDEIMATAKATLEKKRNELGPGFASAVWLAFFLTNHLSS
jgi:hypothetical protein